jgi:hypothetical protein
MVPKSEFCDDMDDESEQSEDTSPEPCHHCKQSQSEFMCSECDVHMCIECLIEYICQIPDECYDQDAIICPVRNCIAILNNQQLTEFTHEILNASWRYVK